MSTRLQGKVALVTGGASGMGRAIAERLAAEGAQVIITDIQPDLGKATAEQCGFTFLEQDTRDESRWNEIIEQVETQFGKLDILVNNAGILGPLDAVNPENTRLADWQTIFAINAEGVFLGCRAAIPAMRKTGGGSIINMSSMGDGFATPNATAYGASKAAVRHFTTSVAKHCLQEKLNIRCNNVNPGVVMTPLQLTGLEHVAREQGISVEQATANLAAKMPMGELTAQEDIAAAVAFLASDDARHITGTKILVDGGFTEFR